MKDGWKIKKLGEVCDYEKTPNKGKNLPYVGLEHIESNTGNFIGILEPQVVKSLTFSFNQGHVLYGRLRPYLNKVLLPDFEGHCSTEIFPIKPNSELTRAFLFYWLLSTEVANNINSTWTGARMPRANMNQVLNFKIPIPPLSEQQHIVAILDQAFANIAKAKENADKNLKNAREAFESYLNGVFSNPGKNWEVKMLSEVYDVRDGTHDSPKYQKEGFALITSKNLKNGTLNFDDIQFISEEDYLKINQRSKVDLGDILFAMIGTIGNPVVVDIEPNFAIKNVALFKVPIEQSSHYLRYYLTSRIVIDKMTKDSKGSTQQFVGLGYLRRFIILLPKLPEQLSIVEKLDELSVNIVKLESIYRQKLSDLEELKKSILQKAFNGELNTFLS